MVQRWHANEMMLTVYRHDPFSLTAESEACSTCFPVRDDYTGRKFPSMTSAVQSRRVRFNAFEVNLGSCELFKHGIRIKLQDQPFQILTILLERPGELVSREELKRRLWADNTFVDFDAGLNAAIRRLRDALSDSADRPRYVETLPRHGYRFIASPEAIAEPKPELKTAPRLETEMGGGHEECPSIPLVGVERAPNPTEAERTRLRLSSWSALAIAGGVALVGALISTDWQSRFFFTHASAGIHSLAVLPLQNLSGDPSQDYFADGMTDALITDLAQIQGLRVISRTSTMRYKGTPKKLPEMAKELNVDAVVEGVVVRSGDRVRIDAQLIRADKDLHLWARSYDRKIGDIVSLQGEIARTIAAEIQIKLTPEEQSRLAARMKPVDPDVYEAYLKGRYFWNKRSLDGYTKGLGFFEQAIQKDPTYADAYAGLADCYNLLGLGMGSLPPREAANRARAAAKKAIELDETLPDGHASLAFTSARYDWNWAEAEQEFKRAIELGPGDSVVYDWYKGYLASVDRTDESLARRDQVQRATGSGGGVGSGTTRAMAGAIAGAYIEANKWDQAIEHYRQAIELEPDSFRMRMDLAGICLENGRYEDAIAEYQKVISLYGDNVYPLAQLGSAYALSGRAVEAEAILNELKRQNRPGFSSYASAKICIALGRKEEAMRWLQKAYEERAPQMIGLNEPAFASLHSDPRFQDLVKRMDFPTDSQQ
jgi:TolB-like protein/DNA-binding winged helix-turn-helix (wHTH) protein/Tfp pilus assembly protein PilF